MKILHLTDPHIVAPGKTLFGLNTAERLRQCVESINRHHLDAELAVITGDLTDCGAIEEYEHLHDILRDIRVPVRLLLGNHDDRLTFRRTFPDHPVDGNGFVQSSIEIEDSLLLFLDSEDGKGSGILCEHRMSFVEWSLAQSTANSVMVFLHHPALSVSVRHFKGMELDDAERLLGTLRRDGRISQLFCGHVHLPVTVFSKGIAQTSARGIGHQIILDLDNPDARFTATEPTYNVIISNGTSTTIHTWDFLERLPLLATSRGLVPVDTVGEAA